MSLIQQIKTDQLQSRKARDTDRSSLLTTLIGEAETIGKNNGNRESTDLEVIGTIKKFIKANNENISMITNETSSLFVSSVRDNQILSQYLPAQVTDSVIESFALIEIKNVSEVSMIMMGIIMKKLNAKYPGQIDGKSASQIIRGVLQEAING